MNKKRYEVLLPYHQYLHYIVEASSPEEALRLAQIREREDGTELSEYCSTGCGKDAKPLVRLEDV